MSINVKIFFNTKIEDPTILTQIADFCLSPVRYLFHGRDVRVIYSFQNQPEICSAKSFSGNAELNQTRRHWVKTVLAIITFVPGILAGIAIKLTAYLDSDVRKKHRLAVTHLTRIPETSIGTEHAPICCEDELAGKLNEIFVKNNNLNQKVETLVIYGSSLSLEQASEELASAHKLILVGTSIKAGSELERSLVESGKWMTINDPAGNGALTLNIVQKDSIDDARRDLPPKRHWLPFSKPYRAVYQFNEAPFPEI